MAWILLVTLMSAGQGSMTTVVFSDHQSCVDAGNKMVNSVNDKTPVFRSYISFQCLQVRGVK